MVWRQKCCWKGIADLVSNYCLHPWDLEEAKESNSYVKYFFYSDICHPGQLDYCKTGIFVTVAVILKPYLEILQSDAPLLPFITSELHVMLETLMGKFVKIQELEAAGMPLKISKVSILETGNHVAAPDWW